MLRCGLLCVGMLWHYWMEQYKQVFQENIKEKNASEKQQQNKEDNK